MAEIPLYKDKKYLKLVEKIITKITDAYESGFVGEVSGKLNQAIDPVDLKRVINALIAQPDRAFLEAMEKWQDINPAALVRKLRTREDTLLGGFQLVKGMEIHHILPQNVMRWYKDLIKEGHIGYVFESLHEYRKQGGTTGVVPENIKSGSKMSHRAWKQMSLIKDAAVDKLKGINSLVSAHVDPLTGLDNPKFFAGGFDRLKSLLNKEGKRFLPNQFFTKNDPIQFIVDTIKEQAGEPSKLFATALDSDFEKLTKAYFSDLVGFSDVFEFAEKGINKGLVEKYNAALKTLKLDYNEIFTKIAKGEKPPQWSEDILDVFDGFAESIKSGKSWSKSKLIKKLNLVKPAKWHSNLLVGRTPAGRVWRGAIPVLGVGADVAHAAGTTKEAFEDPNLTNVVRAGSSIFNVFEQTGLFDFAVQYATDPKRAEEKGRENLTNALVKGSMLTSIPSDDSFASYMKQREMNMTAPGTVEVEEEDDEGNTITKTYPSIRLQGV